jgi:hypothetical protein
MMKPMRFPAPSTRYAPAIEPKATTPAGAVVDATTVEFDEDGRRILTSPLAAPARPVPTVMPPPMRSLPRPPATGGKSLPPLVVPFETMQLLCRMSPRLRQMQAKKQAIGPDDIPY